MLFLRCSLVFSVLFSLCCPLLVSALRFSRPRSFRTRPSSTAIALSHSPSRSEHAYSPAAQSFLPTASPRRLCPAGVPLTAIRFVCALPRAFSPSLLPSLPPSLPRPLCPCSLVASVSIALCLSSPLRELPAFPCFLHLALCPFLPTHVLTTDTNPHQTCRTKSIEARRALLPTSQPDFISINALNPIILHPFCQCSEPHHLSVALSQSKHTDVVHKRCLAQHCSKQPSFGCAGDRSDPSRPVQGLRFERMKHAGCVLRVGG